ncbi:hypothetical protein IQ07DRAFT_592585 [Pyrenochaeta sp. DS3sAY3a]|nr:hypothetical protein IQ07DRAFT_592585 [Pyrenochaeta sp. DS3sAY3a]
MLLSLLPTLLLLLLPNPTHAVPFATLTHLSSNGSDCGGFGGSGIHLGDTSSQLWTVFERFAPYIGPGITLSQGRTICQVTANVSFSEPGYRIMLGSIKGALRGYLKVGKGGIVNVSARYWWEGSTTQGSTVETLRGPIWGTFEQGFGTGQNDGDVWSPCGGGTLNVMYQTRTTAQGELSKGELAVEPQPGEETWHILSGVLWEKCA